MKQYNGKFGCTFCPHSTETINGICKYPITETVYPLRTHDGIIQDMKATVNTREDGTVVITEITGVKGPSTLMNLNYFDLGKCMSAESMHLLYLGAIRQYTELLLSACDKPYYIGSPVIKAMINARLLCFQNPQLITRSPRPIDLINLWKASEWRSWLLFYCLICLKGILPKKYLVHLAKLVAAIEIRLGSSISQEDLNRAHNLLVEFVVYFQEYFGKDQMTYSIHLLLHLVQNVRNLGPLFVHDAFCFENENRLILQLKKIPTEVGVQIAKRYLFYKSIPSFSSKIVVGPRVLKFAEHFENRVKAFIHVNDTVLLGKGSNHQFDEQEKQLGYTGPCSFYKKFVHKKIRGTTKSYIENLKVNDSVIETSSGKTG